MTSQLRAELLKHSSTSTNLGLFLAMLGLVLLAVLLHAVALPVDRLESASDQVQVFRPTWWPAGFTVAIGLVSLSGAERVALTRTTSDGRQ